MASRRRVIRLLALAGLPAALLAQRRSPPPERPRFWVFSDLREALRGKSGDELWAQLRGKLAPRMELQLVSSTVTDRSAIVLLGPPGEAAQVEVELSRTELSRADDAIPAIGDWVEVGGVALALEKEPFMLKLNEGTVRPAGQ